MNNIQRQELLERVGKEKQDYLKMQFSKNPYYFLLRLFGASWWWHIRQLNEMEINLAKKCSLTRNSEGGKS